MQKSITVNRCGKCIRSVVDRWLVESVRRPVGKRDLRLRILCWRSALNTLVATLTRFVRELRRLRFAIWAELPQEADAAGGFSQPSNDYNSEDRVEGSHYEYDRGEHPAILRCRKPTVSNVDHTMIFIRDAASLWL